MAYSCERFGVCLLLCLTFCVSSLPGYRFEGKFSSNFHLNFIC